MQNLDTVAAAMTALFAADHPGEAIDAVFDAALFAGTPVLPLASLHPRPPAPSPFLIGDDESAFFDNELRSAVETLAGYHGGAEMETLSRPLEHTELPGRVGVMRSASPAAAGLAVAGPGEDTTAFLLALAEIDGSVPVLWRAEMHKLSPALAGAIARLIEATTA